MAIPLTGTWEIRSNAPIDSGNLNVLGGTVLISDGAISATRTWQFPSSGYLYLNGDSIPTDFNALPGGWLPARNCSGPGFGIVPPTSKTFATLDISFFPFTKTLIGQGDYLGEIALINVIEPPIVYSTITRLAIEAAGGSSIIFNATADVSDMPSGYNPAIFPPNGVCYITGTYVTEIFTSTLEGGPIGGPYHASPFHPGDEIVINSPNETPNLTDVTEIKLGYTDSDSSFVEITILPIDFLEYTPKTVKFLLPLTLPYNPILPFDFIPFNPTPFEPIIYNPAPPVITQIPITMIVQIVSTKFTGSVLLGTFEIMIADASGIYNITPNKTSDTLYSQNSLTTEEVKIPTPFIKTGFIGG